MSDIFRGDEPGKGHHIYCHAVGDESYFRDDADCEKFLEILEDVIDKTDVVCLAYSLVVNHLHLVLVSGMRWGMSRFMKRLNSRYARYFNKKYARLGHLRRRPFGSEPIESDEQLVTEIRYVLLNRVVAGLVRDLDALEEDRWTSYGIVMRGFYSRIVSATRVHSIFGTSVEEARENLRRFCQAGVEKRDWRAEMTRILECANRYRLSTTAVRTLRPNHDTLEIELDRLAVIVCARIPIDVRALGGGRSRDRAVTKARGIFAFLATRLLGASYELVGQRVGISAFGAAKAADRGASSAEACGLDLTTAADLLGAAHAAAASTIAV